MTFLVWRQYRLQWAIALALLAGFAAVELVNGLHTASAWHSLLATCGAAAYQANGQGTGPGSCGNGASIIDVVGNDFRILSAAVPAVLGILWGAPLVAHEMETGTTGFAWTQGITRTRWLAAKVGILLLAAAVWAGAVSALVTWWSGPENAQRAVQFQPNYFDTQGIVPIGYAVFAMALGITAGVAFRRTLPAIAVTLGGFIGLRVWFSQNIRQHLMPPVTTITSLASTWSPTRMSITLSNYVINGSGQQVTNVQSATMINFPTAALSPTVVPAACQHDVTPAVTATGNGSPALLSCLARAGFRNVFSYQPGSRYWAFQGIETGIFVAIAAVLLAVAWYVVRRRDA
jgi:hypothetical protein